ncbi:MAG TPA: hypothetical protein VL133_03780 [Devosia sp.]|nr:hypothetical protein [Devosia sp.]
MLSLRPAAAALVLLCMTIAQAFAVCPSLPDGPDSQNVTNGQQRALCLQQQLHDNTIARNTQTEITGLQTSIQQMEIQRRFDTLPVFVPAPPWAP